MRWIFSVLLCGIALCHAEQPATTTQTNSLANDPQWLTLLHIPIPGNQSEVDDPKFFFSNSAKAEIELTSTIEQFTKDPASRCRFPARYEWLATQLGWHQQRLTETDCPELFQWYQQLNTQKVSLIFPTAYMNSPSSMFGHLFLRLDAGDTANDLLAFSVNYGANVDSDDGSLTYIYKGLFGGYPGTYTTVPYYEKVKEYNDIEHRDIWEYPLHLSPQQIRLLLLHLWELQNIEIDYYFIDENCAYRILSLLAVVFPELDLMSNYQTRAIPVDVLKTSVEHNMVDKPTYRPSLSTQLLTHYSRLSADERQWLLRILDNTKLLDEEAFLKLSANTKAKIYDTLNLWLRYELSDAGQNRSEANLGYKLLAARSQLNVSSEKQRNSPPPPPEVGHDAYRLGIGYQNRADDDTLILSGRFAYHDILDASQGYLPGAQIEFLNLQIDVGETTKVSKLNVLSLKSLSPRTDLINPVSWSFELAGERLQITEDTNMFAEYIEGKAGYTFGSGSNMFYGLLGLKLLHLSDTSDQPSSLGTVNLGWRMESDFSQFVIELEQAKDVDASNLEMKSVNFGYQFNLSKQSSARLNWSRTSFNQFYDSQVQINYLFYL